MKITAQIKQPIREEMELFERKFQQSMSSKVALLNRITFYIVNRKRETNASDVCFFGSKNGVGRENR